MKEKIQLQTPSQTIGPYFAYGLTPEQYNYDFPSLVDGNMVKNVHGNEVITITGIVYDGHGNPIDDAMLELWQNDGEHKRFGRYGTGTDKNNAFTFTTIKPKPIDGNAPFINVILFMRGQLLHSYTRIYFSDEVALNATDETLRSIPEERRETVVAKKEGESYVFNIHMQGDKETVFFKL
ncbi:protocatechuate 3,4-dioxygenase subunit alpha [Winogradskyella echinorum]|uniref:Protocatechuate 3,4-dioxygenase subunit alpha n=1 Tax=Winogradskyella echinorum TaxID=538189 RepID=A0ABR6Y0W4_9FLAO|nr:protocatechuate 3,4-dioxygenase subunit alpha [Winogradskyella echinorum]MBC3846304.1 protocatechuate 3,4-dioxygenase subunit alpha [Winogradskyella echinorum]MBC5750652.1 protocatechuate 3,4-dioxygenase subunit alpha [Winogradskyella echinorum]